MLRLADVSELFYKKMTQLKDEADARSLKFVSLAEQNPEKFSLLENSRVKDTYE
jgi:hypothetical protein